MSVLRGLTKVVRSMGVVVEFIDNLVERRREFPVGIDESPCDEGKHDYEVYVRDHYHSSQTAHYRGGPESFKIWKVRPEKCRKCGDYREIKSDVGRVKVDDETGELTVIQD